MINIHTKDGVRICEVRDGPLWTFGHSVTRCRMSQAACEAALLFVPHVTYEQLESIVRRMSELNRRQGYGDAGITAMHFAIDFLGSSIGRRTDRRALAEIEDRERAQHDYAPATVQRPAAWKRGKR